MAKDYCTCIECGKRVSNAEYIRYGGLCQECYAKTRKKPSKSSTNSLALKSNKLNSKRYDYN